LARNVIAYPNLNLILTGFQRATVDQTCERQALARIVDLAPVFEVLVQLLAVFQFALSCAVFRRESVWCLVRQLKRLQMKRAEEP